MSADASGLSWDAVCFVFLLLQLRIYKSHYFRHIVTELMIENKLEARGAELTNTNLIRRVEERKEKEAEILNNIKKKMERLKLRQERLHQKSTIDSDDHFIVIRSGDYYMFEDDSDDEESSLDQLEQLEPPSEAEGKVGPLEILNTVATSKDSKEAIQRIRRQSSVRESLAEDDERRSSTSLSPGSPRTSVQEDIGPVSPRASKLPQVSEEEMDADECEQEDGEGEKKESLWKRFKTYMQLTWAVIGGLLDYLIGVLEDISREYREVSKILDKEKEVEKQKLLDSNAEQTAAVTDGSADKNGDEQTKNLDKADPSAVHLTLDLEPATQLDKKTEGDAEDEFVDQSPRLFQLGVALFDALISNSEVVCYFAMILNHLVTASILTMFYPISVFLWAMLSVPRPTKAYWVTIITYTEAVVVVKYLFQFGFFPWNDDLNNDPLWPPRIIGIQRLSNYAAYDLFLLVCLFIHRSILKRNGLWKDAFDAKADLAKAEYKERTQSRIHTPAITPMTDTTTVVTPETEEGKDVDDDPDSLKKLISSEDTVPENGDAVSSHGTPRKGKSKTEQSMFAMCFAPFKKFYRQMRNPKFSAASDVYASMFFCDFINFFIVVFGYKDFGPVIDATAGTGSNVVESVISENKVPLPFLLMLLTLFVLIIIDRALYLRKLVVGKFIYQIFYVLMFHVWMFFILPLVTHRSFTENISAQLFYFIKCIYFGLSAIQIRSAYPARILGNFLTRNYDYYNLFLFKGFLAVPFLLELRALMDWMWTDTTLTITAWLEMEDIYANIFQLKCWRRAEAAYPTPRGVKKSLLIKYGVGGFLLFALIFIIWFPLLLFSLADTVFFNENLPVDCSLEIQLGGYESIFHMSTQSQFIQPMTDNEYAQLKDLFANNGAATSFLSGYKASDVSNIKINGNSTAIWVISPPSEEALESTLLNEKVTVNIYVRISFTRTPKPGLSADTVTGEYPMELAPDDKIAMEIRTAFAKQIKEKNATTPLWINGLVPKFIHVPADDTPTVIGALEPNKSSQTNISFSLLTEGVDQWWELREYRRKEQFRMLSDLVVEPDVLIIAFNDRVAPASLSFFTGYGIIGLYVSVILVIGQFVRIFFSGLSSRIMFFELPNVDKILKLCLDIYTVREVKELRLEEELFAKLIFLYRSSETMVKWTKHKVE